MKVKKEDNDLQIEQLPFNENEAKITLELTEDLVIDGSLIVGAQIGVSKLGSGDIAGEFASINLNGHTITINNGGSIEGNGLIYDSTGKGKIVVKTGGKLFTNTALANYKDFSEVERRINGGANLFDSYKFSSLKVEATFEAGSIFETSFTYKPSFFKKSAVPLVAYIP